jgi:CubicO group peptidase (beta-lactamase class C family)
MGIENKLSTYINNEIDLWDFSGVIRVLQNGKIIFETSRGFANIEFGIKNSMTTRFSIASVTKQFTAFAIMILYDKGLLKLDEKANQYLPSNIQISSNITVHHLLSHTSGLYNFYNFEDDFYVEEDRAPYNKNAFSIDWIYKKQVNEPGTVFNYNNSNYNLLAWIIENISGQTYNEFLTTNIFIPLGMSNSEYDNGQNILIQKAYNYMRDYGKLVRIPYTNNLFSIGAGALVTNCDDIQRWYECLKNKEILSEQAYNIYFRENINHYCYGLERYNEGEKIKYSHGGDYLGVSAYTQYFFEQDICIMIISNTESLNQYRFGNSIAAITCGDLPKISCKPEETFVSLETLETYTGTYLPGKIHIEVKDGKLYLVRVNQNIHIEQYCVGNNLFMRRYEEQQEPHNLFKEGAIKPSVWGYELVSKQFI